MHFYALFCLMIVEKSISEIVATIVNPWFS